MKAQDVRSRHVVCVVMTLRFRHPLHCTCFFPPRLQHARCCSKEPIWQISHVGGEASHEGTRAGKCYPASAEVVPVATGREEARCKTTAKVLPCPSPARWTVMPPPWHSTMDWAIARLSPIPP